jgi:hypothetical protein
VYFRREPLSLAERGTLSPKKNSLLCSVREVVAGWLADRKVIPCYFLFLLLASIECWFFGFLEGVGWLSTVLVGIENWGVIQVWYWKE